MGQLDLNAARVLVRVVQAGSFRAAALQLGMPKTSVSRKVAELEEYLGAQLLRRTTRTLSLTDAGAAFVEQAEGAIARFTSAERAVSEQQREPRGLLRVTATVTVGQTLLAPLLAEFLQAYPAVEVSLHLTDRHVDVVAERFDVALRIGALADSSLVAQHVVSSGLQLFASPRYLRTHGTPRTPADLAAHDCLRFAKTGVAVRGTWPLGKGKRTKEVSVSGRLVADDWGVLREAAATDKSPLRQDATVPNARATLKDHIRLEFTTRRCCASQINLTALQRLTSTDRDAIRPWVNRTDVARRIRRNGESAPLSNGKPSAPLVFANDLASLINDLTRLW